MTDKSLQLTDILRKHLKDIEANRLHLKADMTDKMMSNVFKGLKLPMVYDEIIGFMRIFFSGAFKDNKNLSYGYLRKMDVIYQE